jgi:hypothetical protein
VDKLNWSQFRYGLAFSLLLFHAAAAYGIYWCLTHPWSWLVFGLGVLSYAVRSLVSA